jgi:hypothetical protein
MNVPEGYLELLGPLPPKVKFLKKMTGPFDFLHLFVKNSHELKNLFPKAKKVLRYDGIFWISYPKKSAKTETDLSRDTLWQLLVDKGFRPVSAVSINATWSALRFRPPETVKSKK